jgi:HlyD family secretion protein
MPVFDKPVTILMRVMYIFPMLILLGCSSDKFSEVETSTVKRGDFVIDITEEGKVEATSALNISSPNISWRFGMLKITYLIEDGAQVSPGDTVIEFDPSDVQKAIIDAKANLDIAKANLEKQHSQNESSLADLKADLKVRQIDYQISEIKLEQAVYESDITRKEIQLSLDRSKIELEKARQEIENQKKIQHEEIQKIKLKIKQLETELEEAYETLNSLVVTSPGSGIAIIMENRRTDAKWQVGDQPWSGYPLVNLPDMSELKAEVEIHEVDISKIRLGQKVEIRLDANSDSIFSGKVGSVANLATYKNRNSKIKVFPVEINIDGTSEQLLPGITVSCRILTNEIRDVLYISLESVFTENSRDYVYLKNQYTFEKTEIKTGKQNKDFVMIRQGLEHGDELAMTNPFAEDEEGEEN